MMTSRLNSTKLSLLICTATLIIQGCAEGGFSGNSNKIGKKKETKSGNDLPAEQHNPETSNEIPGDNVDSGSGNTAAELKAKCWFAVSGAYHGITGANKGDVNVFPATISGKPIATGERFDYTGGVYLNARDTPYVYRDGSGLLDPVVDTTFDSIAIAPGMTIELRDSRSTVLYSGTGPLIGIENQYKNNSADNIVLIKQKSSVMPKWMIDYVDQNKTLVALPLQTTRSVLVKATPGGPCSTEP